MKIPGSFQVMGLIYRVEYSDDIGFDHDINGDSSYRRCRLRLQRPSGQSPRQMQQVEQTFCHELMHVLLFHAENEKHEGWLHQDEQLVDRLGSLLQQVLNTFEGEPA